MTRNEQQLYKDISELTKAVQKLVKLLTKIAKEQNDQNKCRNTTRRIKRSAFNS